MPLLVSLFCAVTALAAQSEFAIRNVDVFDGYRMLRAQTVTVRDGMIVAIEPAQGPASGKTLLPGLIDAHVHIGDADSLRQAAALGVTTELDMYASDMKLLMKLRAANDPNAADFRTAGYGVTVPKGHPTEMLPPGMTLPTLGPHDDAQAFVDARIAEGSDYIKIMYEHKFPTLTKEQLAAVVRAAHRRGKLAISHIGTQAEAYDAIEAGVDGLAHIFMDSAPRADFAAVAASHHIFQIGTLSVLEAFSGNPQGERFAVDPHFAPYLTPAALDILRIKLPPRVSLGVKFAYALAAMRAEHEAGVTILAGTDAPNPDTAWGVSLHREMELLTQCGLTPLQALQAATSAPAQAFFLVDRGRIEVGRRADLVLVNGDPSKDIRATRDIVSVWKAGRQVDRTKKK
ncbi:MAG TPA: amidohydrolase family protein [Candidatus Limnocylindrales bacterium]|nr:amidohydrolase family protein [Candidatus Limnocylindrales bacterium]